MPFVKIDGAAGAAASVPTGTLAANVPPVGPPKSPIGEIRDGLGRAREVAELLRELRATWAEAKPYVEAFLPQAATPRNDDPRDMAPPPETFPPVAPNVVQRPIREAPARAPAVVEREEKDEAAEAHREELRALLDRAGKDKLVEGAAMSVFGLDPEKWPTLLDSLQKHAEPLAAFFIDVSEAELRQLAKSAVPFVPEKDLPMAKRMLAAHLGVAAAPEAAKPAQPPAAEVEEVEEEPTEPPAPKPKKARKAPKKAAKKRGASRKGGEAS